MPKNLNDPKHWLAWLRACQKDPALPFEARGPLAMLTGTDVRVLSAIAHCFALCGYHDDDPRHQAALVSVRALLPSLQGKCWPFARELIAQQLDWKDRDRLWPLVLPSPIALVYFNVMAKLDRENPRIHLGQYKTRGEAMKALREAYASADRPPHLWIEAFAKDERGEVRQVELEDADELASAQRPAKLWLVESGAAGALRFVVVRAPDPVRALEVGREGNCSSAIELPSVGHDAILWEHEHEPPSEREQD